MAIARALATRVSTFGSADNALTAGAGLAYGGDDRGGIVMIGGERRVRRNLKLITENYLWKGGNGFVSGGIRLIGERLSADLALAVPDRHGRRDRISRGEFRLRVLGIARDSILS